MLNRRLVPRTADSRHISDELVPSNLGRATSHQKRRSAASNTLTANVYDSDNFAHTQKLPSISSKSKRRPRTTPQYENFQHVWKVPLKQTKNKPFMRPLWKVKTHYSAKESRSMKKMHLKHIQKDSENLYTFLQPSTGSEAYYDATMEQTKRLKTDLLGSKKSSKRKSRKKGAKPITLRLESETSNALHQDDLESEIEVQNFRKQVEKQCEQNWKKMIQFCGGKEQEYELQKHRKPHKRLSSQNQEEAIENVMTQMSMFRSSGGKPARPSISLRRATARFLPITADRKNTVADFSKFYETEVNIEEWELERQSGHSGASAPKLSTL